MCGIVDLILLCFAYVLSQFYRAFLAVLTEVLERDVGASPEDLATASGLWFLAFAAMQIPVGWALDKVGPRRTASVLLLIGGGGGAGSTAVQLRGAGRQLQLLAAVRRAGEPIGMRVFQPSLCVGVPNRDQGRGQEVGLSGGRSGGIFPHVVPRRRRGVRGQ